MKRTPTEATQRSAKEVRLLNRLLTAAGFVGGLRAFIAAVWGVSKGRAVFDAPHAEVGQHGHPDRSDGAAEAYVRRWLDRLEKEQPRLGVYFIRFRLGYIDETTGKHIPTRYDCSLLYDAVEAMNAREREITDESIRAGLIVDQLRVEPTTADDTKPDTKADPDALKAGPVKALKAMAVSRLWLVKAARLAGDDPRLWLKREIEQAQRVLERLEGQETAKGVDMYTLDHDHRGEEEGGGAGANPSEQDEKPQQKGHSRATFCSPSPALDDLQKFPQWVAWFYLTRTNKAGETKTTKPPINPHTGTFAKVDDPATWGTYQEAVDRAGEGVGFVLAETDPFAGIDIDHCISETGEIETWALDVIRALDSYSERSPSGRGIRIFVGGKLLGKGVNRQVEGHKIEVYDNERYLTFTGDHIEGTPLTIEYRQTELTELYNQIAGTDATTEETASTKSKPPSPPSCDQSVLANERLTEADNALIDRLSKWKNGEKFVSLYDGDASGYESPSQADAGLCCMVGFATKDKAQIRRIVRNSSLRDEADSKRNRADYWERTITNALKKVEESKGKFARASG